ncbi:DUF6894 family protein [Methylobacterium nigriterrae]|uniref:DUF6894 family protein n=1 Tax=Methylobacterium nigriterrae TaxID=3127512 RepID=UPI003D6684F2
MAQRLFFDLSDGMTTLRDDAGVEVHALWAALQQAQRAIDELRGIGELNDGGDWRLNVRDENGIILKVLPLD